MQSKITNLRPEDPQDSSAVVALAPVVDLQL